MTRITRMILAGAAALMSFAIVGTVAAMTVQPVVIDLRMSGRESSAAIRVENTGPNPLPVEVRVVETEFQPDAVRASDRVSEDLLVFPPQAIIRAGETQVFRLQYVGDPASDRSKHYYVEVAQLPVDLPEGQSAIQILYNFQVMVNVASLTAEAPQLSIEGAEIVQNADGRHFAAFTVRNTSMNYGYLSQGNLTIVHRDSAGAETLRQTMNSSEIQQMIGYGLVGPGVSRRFISPVEVGAEGAVEVSLSMSRR